MNRIAAALLLLGVLKHFGYELAPADMSDERVGLVWNALGSLATTGLLAIVWARYRSPVVGLVVMWWLYEEALVCVCSAWRLVDWWPVAEGEQQCTAKLGPNLGAISLVIVGACIAKVSSERRSRE